MNPARREAATSPGRSRWWLAAVAALTVGGIASALLWPRGESASTGTSLQVSKPEFVATIGAEGEGLLRQPVGIAVDGDRVYVADAGRREIVTFTTEGEFVRAFGADRLAAPLYVARNPLDGLLYVTDRNLKAIVEYKVDGTFVETFTASVDDAAGASVVATWQPMGLAFADDGSLYVSDVGTRQRIARFSPTLRYLGETPASMPDGPLSFVNGLAVADGIVLVADGNNARLVTFTEALGYVKAAPFGGLPRGVCPVRRPGGTVFAVVDATGGAVVVVQSDGVILASTAARGTGESQLLQPTSVATDGHGLLFVTDTGHARISVWRVTAGSTTGVFADMRYDPRWWVAAGIALAGMAAVASIILSGRKRSRTI